VPIDTFGVCGTFFDFLGSMAPKRLRTTGLDDSFIDIKMKIPVPRNGIFAFSQILNKKTGRSG